MHIAKDKAPIFIFHFFFCGISLPEYELTPFWKRAQVERISHTVYIEVGTEVRMKAWKG